jgi:hypothetical protein
MHSGPTTHDGPLAIRIYLFFLIVFSTRHLKINRSHSSSTVNIKIYSSEYILSVLELVATKSLQDIYLFIYFNLEEISDELNLTITNYFS